jgi:dolichyl-diphosphooligosaccharide--protein glycosyltransferase
LRYESIIHEFDPWFNFRATRFLVSEGFDEFIDWFDDKTWYPLGRWIGNTLYPGLMWTAAVGYKILHSLNLPVDIRDVCVFLAPFMASNTALVTYFLTKECWTSSAGVVAAAFVALTPGYISRSVAGSYDNEAVAIFAMLLTFYLWVKAVHTGSAFWSGLCALGYFYMVAAWGGYIFITNIIPCHVLAIILFGKMNSKVYVAYSIWYPLGTLLSMTIGFVSFIPVSSPEHAGAFGVFCLLQVWLLYTYLQGILHKSQFQYVIYLAVMTIFAGIVIIGLLAYSGTIPFLTGRLKSLLGSTSNIAIVKSVSEHQPTAWGTFFLDMHFCLIYAVPGLYYCFHYLTNENLFLILYLLFASYFSSIMVRLMLVIAPIVCIVGGIGMSEFILTFCQSYLTSTPDSPEESTSTEPKETPTSKSGKDSKKAKEAKGLIFCQIFSHSSSLQEKGFYF